MYEKILVPLDGSELAETVVPYVGALAARMDSEITLLHVCSPNEAHYYHVNQIYLDKLAESLRSELLTSREKTIDIITMVGSGSSAEEISGYAESNAINLIAMSTHGRAGVGRWALGSVADKLVKSSRTPILLVRSEVPERIPAESWPTKGILVPLDGSEFGETALPYVEELAKTLDKEVVLLQVVTTEFRFVADMSGGGVFLTGQDIKAWTSNAEAYLNKIVARLKDKGISSQILVMVGGPADRVVECVKEYDVDLVVMSTHGHSGIARWILGSVAQRVLEGVGTPLMLVRPSSSSR